TSYLTCMYLFFFSSRRRHTRSDRDWSSDVCSSDLASVQPLVPLGYQRLDRRGNHELKNLSYHAWRTACKSTTGPNAIKAFYHQRSEERRVGKECRSRRSPYN